jgi:hypothetical protein
MNHSDKPRRVTITALDRYAFAASSNLAALPMKVYQQDFIELEYLP